MYVQNVDDATCCRYFSATLKGIAQKWFNGPPNGSVASFLQLAKLFSAHFIASKREKKTSIHLAKIQQQRGEDMKECVRRFNHEAIVIPKLQDGVAYTTFLNRSLPGKFKFSLAESRATTVADALRKAQDFIQVTEICTTDEPQQKENRKRSGKDQDA